VGGGAMGGASCAWFAAEDATNADGNSDGEAAESGVSLKLKWLQQRDKD